MTAETEFSTAYWELVNALIGLVPVEKRNLFEKVSKAHQALVEKTIDLMPPIYEEPGDALWNGFVLGLLLARRPDLIASRPEAKKAWLLLEASELIRTFDPPPA